VRSSKTLKTYIHIKSFPMEVAVDSNIPQGFDMDDGNAAPIYRPDIQVEQEPEQQEEEQVQPIYYEIPMPKQQEHHQQDVIYQQAPPPQQDTVLGGISPLVWMVIVFVAFILGFFMGMGAGGRNSGPGQAAPIILTSGRGG
jgi:hypothetical protein